MKYLVTVFLFFVQLQLVAQKFSISNGDTLHFDKNSFSSEIIAQDSTAFYVYTKGDDYSLRKFRLHDAKQLYETILTADKDFFKVSMNRGFQVKHIEIANNRILFFVEISENSHYILTLLEFDATTGKQIGEPIVFDEQSTKGYREYAWIEKNMGKVDFKINFSPDKTKLLVITEKLRNEKQPDVTARLYSVKNYAKIWEKHTLKTFNNSTVFGYNYLTDDEGNFFYLFNYLRSSKEDDISMAVGTIGKNDHQNKTYPIPDKGRTTKETKLKILENKILCYGKFLDGEYTSYNMSPEKCGYFLTCIDAGTFKIETENFDYTKDYFQGYKASAERLGNSSDVSVVKINGSYYFIKEFTWMINFKMNLLVCKYNAQNKLEWMKEINRDCEGPQGLDGEKIRGFGFLVDDNRLKMFFNEHKKNIIKFPDVANVESSKYVALKSLKDATLVCISMDGAGTLTREIVPKTQEIFVGGEFPDNLWIKKSKSMIVRNYIEKNKRSYSTFRVGS